jgi:hypothetical protein
MKICQTRKIPQNKAQSVNCQSKPWSRRPNLSILLKDGPFCYLSLARGYFCKGSLPQRRTLSNWNKIYFQNFSMNLFKIELNIEFVPCGMNLLYDSRERINPILFVRHNLSDWENRLEVGRAWTQNQSLGLGLGFLLNKTQSPSPRAGLRPKHKLFHLCSKAWALAQIKPDLFSKFFKP